MRVRPDFRLPQEHERILRRAAALEWVTIGFLLSIAAVMYLVMGSSQAMKTAWIEDVLSLVPPIVFLISVPVRDRPPNARFPYGYRRAVQLAFLCAAVAVAGLGLYLISDAAIKLIAREHPTIGAMRVFGRDVWQGWVMLAALVYSVVPPVVLGRMKLPLARKLHEKTLHADAMMNKADWMTGAAAAAGVVGIGYGLWWTDAAAAGLIALNVAYDGLVNVKRAMADLMDHRPTGVDHGEAEPLDEQIVALLERYPWVRRAAVRLREEGHVVCGEAFLEITATADAPSLLEDAHRAIQRLHWRIYDIVLMPVKKIE